MMTGGLRLRTLGTLWVALAMVAGIAATALFLHSAQAWSDHLTRAHRAGLSTYEALRTGRDPGLGLQITPLSPEEASMAESGKFDQIADAPRPGYVTILSLQGADGAVRLGAVSDVLRYPVADIVPDRADAASAQLAALTRLFATYCSDPVLYARLNDRPWARVDGRAVWGCAAAPADMRLVAVLLALVALAALVTHVGNTTQAFETFAAAFRNRRLGGPDTYETAGPSELRDIVAAINGYLAFERRQLANRAAVLSSVSHDLGTPATRLRLRTALIEDNVLRGKLDADIDQMTGIIESVLTYTRAEMNLEEPRRLSLMSLLETVVADYQDIGHPVSLAPLESRVLEGGMSVFSAVRGHSVVDGDGQVIVNARPVSLKRAITNLVDNGLKYGRRAHVSVVADAATATIVIEDDGSDRTAAEMAELIAPFRRGPGSAGVQGHGLGLSIVATIADLHGGTLSFEDGRTGLRALLRIQRA